jgi:hypothetical protein
MCVSIILVIDVVMFDGGGVCVAHLYSLLVLSYYVSLRSKFCVVVSVTNSA